MESLGRKREIEKKIAEISEESISNIKLIKKMILNSYDNQNEDNFYSELGKLNDYL